MRLQVGVRKEDGREGLREGYGTIGDVCAGSLMALSRLGPIQHLQGNSQRPSPFRSGFGVSRYSVRRSPPKPPPFSSHFQEPSCAHRARHRFVVVSESCPA